MHAPGWKRWAFRACLSSATAGLFASCGPTRPPVVHPPQPPASPVTQPVEAPLTEEQKEAKALGHFLKSRVALTAGDYAAALRELRDAVRHDPDSTFLRLRLASLAVRQGEVAEALEHSRVVVEREPDHLDARLLLAGLLSSTGEEEEAARIYAGLVADCVPNQ